MSNFVTISKDTPFDQVQAILDANRMVFFDEGAYNLTKSLYYTSNSFILLHPNANLRRCMSTPIFTPKVTSNTKGYDGVRNVRFEGGKLFGNGENSTYGNTFAMCHCRDIKVEDMIIEDAKGCHGIEINSSKGIKIRDTKFHGYVVNPDGAYREAIQIDFAAYGLISSISDPNAAFYDDTHCEDILIENCIFDKSALNLPPVIAIGTHTQTVSDNKHKNIRIINNDAVGRGAVGGYGYFLSLANMEDVMVAGNKLANYTRFCRVATFDTAYQTDGTRVDNLAGAQGGCVNIVFEKNVEKDVLGSYLDYGIFVYSKTAARHKDIIARHNTFRLGDVSTGGKYAIDIQATDGAIIERNKAYGLPTTVTHWRDLDSTEVEYV